MKMREELSGGFTGDRESRTSGSILHALVCSTRALDPIVTRPLEAYYKTNPISEIKL